MTPSPSVLREVVDLVRLAVPTALTRASFVLMGLTDAVVLARVSPGELPRILNGWFPLAVAMGLGLGLMIGVQVVTAELAGAGRAAESGRVFRRGTLVALAYGLAAMVASTLLARPLVDAFGFDGELAAATAACTCILAYGLPAQMLFTACANYLEALRLPGVVTVIGFAAVVANVFLDLALVPTRGAAGVAWATTICRIGMAALGLVAAVWLTPALRRHGRPDPGEFRRQSFVGLGAGIANVAEWGSFTLTHVLATLVSVDAGAVWGLTTQVMSAAFMISIGLGSATGVRVAEAQGRRDARGVTSASRLGMLTWLVVGGVLALTMWIAREPLAATGLDAEQSAEAADLVPVLATMLAAAALVTIFDGLQGVASMALRAQEVVWLPTAIHLAAYVVLMLPACILLAFPLGLGLWGVFLGVAGASVLAGILQAVVLEVTCRRRMTAHRD